MKNIIIKDEQKYNVISGNAISILNELPASVYELVYKCGEGFVLNASENHFNITEKLYGEVETITRKVLHSFETAEGNLGVLFSGPKGLGKSLTIRNICVEAIKKGFPVILVKEHFEGINQFIETICQRVVVVFDEFEKIYPSINKTSQTELEGQDSLLNLFDTTLLSKKLFLLTCNDVRNLTEYLINRPGRLHYHFRMYRLSIAEITEYCTDNLSERNRKLIPEICSLGAVIPDFSYDMLRAIIFELNTYQCGLQEARSVLNIDARIKSPFNYTVYFKSGRTETGFNYLDMGHIQCSVEWNRKSTGYREIAKADMTKVQWTGDADGSLLLEESHIKFVRSEDVKEDGIEKIIFIPAKAGYLSGDSDYRMD